MQTIIGDDARESNMNTIAQAVTTKTETRQRGRKKARPDKEKAIYDAIYDAIMEHRLPPGTKLTEATFCELFGVSRTIVRKALARLAHENIVELIQNRGAAVASPTVEETHDVFEARRVVESAIMRSVVQTISQQELAQLRTLVRQERIAYDSRDYGAAVRLSGEFHLRLAAIGRNSVLAKFLNELVMRSSLIIALYEAPGQSPCSYDEHFMLLDTITQGDEAQTIDKMEAHLLACESRLNLADKDKVIDLTEIFAPSVRKSP